MNGQDFDCNDGDGRCYDCPHTEQCDYYKYLLGERKDEGLTYFEKIQNEARNEEDWKLQICCDQMDFMVGKEIVKIYKHPKYDGPGFEPSAYIDTTNDYAIDLDYCPWCGKIITFRRGEE